MICGLSIFIFSATLLLQEQSNILLFSNCNVSIHQYMNISKHSKAMVPCNYKVFYMLSMFILMLYFQIAKYNFNVFSFVVFNLVIIIYLATIKFLLMFPADLIYLSSDSQLWLTLHDPMNHVSANFSSSTISQRSSVFLFVALMMPSIHLVLCHLFHLLPVSDSFLANPVSSLHNKNTRL